MGHSFDLVKTRRAPRPSPAIAITVARQPRKFEDLAAIWEAYERLYAAGLWDAWEPAAAAGNRRRMIELLHKVDLPAHAEKISNIVSADPKRYGF